MKSAYIYRGIFSIEKKVGRVAANPTISKHPCLKRVFLKWTIGFSALKKGVPINPLLPDRLVKIQHSPPHKKEPRNDI